MGLNTIEERKREKRVRKMSKRKILTLEFNTVDKIRSRFERTFQRNLSFQ